MDISDSELSQLLADVIHRDIELPRHSVGIALIELRQKRKLWATLREQYPDLADYIERVAKQ